MNYVIIYIKYSLSNGELMTVVKYWGGGQLYLSVLKCKCILAI